MPIWKRKRVQPEFFDATCHQPDKQVFYLRRTGEIFPDYVTYSTRLAFYQKKQFQCELTGKSSLDFFQALESEKKEAETLHARFPMPLKVAVLSSVQWQIVGRLDGLVDAVHDRFRDRYFVGENVLVDLQGDKYPATVRGLYPPNRGQSSRFMEHSTAHSIGTDLRIPAADANERDDPLGYFYKVQIIDGDARAGDAYSQHPTDNEPHEGSAKWGGSIMDVQCGSLSRDRLVFSKSLLKRFLRDSIDRDASVASPWILKPDIAIKYGLNSIMPEDVQTRIDEVRRTETNKRRKNCDDKAGTPGKRRKKSNDANDVLAAPEATEVAKPLEDEKKKKKPVKYPTEDLDVQPTDREKRNGIKMRPSPKRDVPFDSVFEPFLMTWNFLQIFGISLNLSPFTLDEFEQAILHSEDSPCFLLAEIHTSLVYNIRQVPTQRNLAISSLYEYHHSTLRDGTGEGSIVPDLINALVESGGSWERSALRSTATREGWLDSVLGIVKDHATTELFPRLVSVLSALLKPPTEDETPDKIPSGRPSVATYHRLSGADKIALLSFLCDCSISSKPVRSYMESCEEQLTSLRKERTELNRERKRCVEQMDEIFGRPDQKKKVAEFADTRQVEPSTVAQNRGVSSEDGDSGEHSSRGTSASITTRPTIPSKAEIKSHAHERRVEREKVAKEKVALAEFRRLQEETNKFERRLEVIDIEFRKLQGAIRTRPLGKDRFFTRIWWLDGLGGSSLYNQGSTSTYGAGRLFIQGPSEVDWEALERREAENLDVMVRMRHELSDDGVMDIGEWGYFDDAEEIEQLLAWLNHKGRRELQLKNTLTAWKPAIFNTIKRRTTCISTTEKPAKPPTNRDSKRHSRQVAINYEDELPSYLTWSNSRAPSNGSQ